MTSESTQRPDANTTPRTRRLPIHLATMLGVVVLVAASAGFVAATPKAPSPVPATIIAPATAVPTEEWAWGVAQNLSLSYSFVGAYNSSSSLLGSNLTQSGAYVNLQATASIEYAAYVVVTAEFPTNSTVSLSVQAAEYAAEEFSIFASGTFPAAGTYNATTTVVLQPLNFSLTASIASLTTVAGYLNFTAGPNGSLALENEHIQLLRALALSLVAQNFPNATTTPSGDTVLKYVSGALSEDAWAAVNFTAIFAPALELVQGPLAVGNQWQTSSTAAVNGTLAYAAQFSATLPGGPTYRWSASAAAAVSASVPVDLAATVVGTKTIHLPDGSAETDYEIQYVTLPGGANWSVTNGLFVIPGGNGTSETNVTQAIPEAPARAAAQQSPSSAAVSLYSPTRHLPDSQVSHPPGANPATAAPMNPDTAEAAMHQLKSPQVPLGYSTTWVPAVAFLAAVVIAVSLTGLLVYDWRERRRYR